MVELITEAKPFFLYLRGGGGGGASTRAQPLKAIIVGAESQGGGPYRHGKQIDGESLLDLKNEQGVVKMEKLRYRRRSRPRSKEERRREGTCASDPL